MRARHSAVAAIWAVLVSASLAFGAETLPFVARGTHGMVASDSPYASQAGCEILKAGGNAVDAAVATSLALSVTRPFSTGLGGGGFMMVRLASGEVHVLDYRECAPGAAAADMFVKARAASNEGLPPSEVGGLAVGVPGLAAGHKALLERLGTRKYAKLIEPARRLAENGFAVDRSYVLAAKSVWAKIEQYPSTQKWTRPLRARFNLDRPELEQGSIVRQPELAAALRLMAEQGPDAFYRGPIADGIVQAVRGTGGILTHEDLARYTPRWREPIRVPYRERFEVLLMPPPSSGGVVIAEALNILEPWPIGEDHRRDPGLAAHLLVEAIKHGMADRARYLGDTDFADVPVARLVGKDYAEELRRRIDPDRVGKPERYGSVPKDDGGTSHYCVVDSWGNVVSATETINTSFGSLVMAERWGIVLNNEMDDFSAEPDAANAYNLRQSPANVVAPFKRPLSSMSPTIVLENGRPRLAVGGSGGPRIITGTLQVMLYVLDYGMPVGEALAHPRLHHQWYPDEVYRNEFPADDPVVKGLVARGHVVSASSSGAIIQAITIEGRDLVGASDPRKGGMPAGY